MVAGKYRVRLGMVERYSMVAVVPDDCQKVFSVWSEEVLRRCSTFLKDSARDKFVRESRHLYGGQVRKRRGQCETRRDKTA